MSSGTSLDMVVVGAGHIGIEMAVQLKQEGYTFRHFEAGSLGSTIEWWAPETVFFSSSDRIAISGVAIQNSSQTKASREEYLSYLRAVVRQFDLSIETYTRVLSIDRSDKGYTLTVAKSYHGVGGPAEIKSGMHFDDSTIEKVNTKRIVLVIGDMHRPNMLAVEGENLPHVSHHFLEPHRYSGSRVLVVGGMNSAVEAAIRLVRVGAKVSFCQRKLEFDPARIKPWLLPELKSMIRNNSLRYLPGHCVKRIESKHAVLVKTAPHEDPVPEITIDADHVLLLTGYKQDPDLYQSAGITLQEPHLKPVYNPMTMESNQSGIYLAGTGAAGTQVGKVIEFIETSHIHIKKIIAHLKGEPPPDDTEFREVAHREL